MYYKTKSTLSEKIISSESSVSYLKVYEMKLMETGIAQEEVQKYALDMAQISYPCIGKFNLFLNKFKNADLVKTKVALLLERLKHYYLENNKFPTDIVEIDQNSSYLGKAFIDTSFYIKNIDDENIDLRTIGEDLVKDTSDDIIVGKISKNG